MFLISQIVDYKLLPNYHCHFGSFPIELYELFIHHHHAWGGWGWRVEHLEIKCFCKDKDQATSASISLVRTIHMSTFSFRGVETYCPCVQTQRTVYRWMLVISSTDNDLVANKNLFNFFLFYFFFQFLSIASKMFVFGVSSPSSMSAHFGRPWSMF